MATGRAWQPRLRRRQNTMGTHTSMQMASRPAGKRKGRGSRRVMKCELMRPSVVMRSSVLTPRSVGREWCYQLCSTMESTSPPLMTSACGSWQPRVSGNQGLGSSTSSSSYRDPNRGSRLDAWMEASSSAEPVAVAQRARGSENGGKARQGSHHKAAGFGLMPRRIRRSRHATTRVILQSRFSPPPKIFH
jgi:hypothetical protein